MIADLGSDSANCIPARRHRKVSPAETVERAWRLAPVLGITRIADVTGLDTIGIPVVMVVRPNARSLSVSQGKGATLDAAKASGLMESIEMAHAEQIDLPLKLATHNELRFTHRMADVNSLPRVAVTQFHANKRSLWIEGKNLVDGGSTWVPYEMVHMDYTLPLPSGSGSFLMSSSGLASGNHPSEALLHALCELVERDAATLHRFSSEAVRRQTRVDLRTVDDMVCRGLLDQYERAGILVAVWEITSDIGVAAFACTIVDRDPNPHRPVGPMDGYGCHPSRAVALSRALTEAAQSRLTIITGSRDDVRHHGPAGPEGDYDAAITTRDKLLAEATARSYRDAPDFAGSTLEQDIQWIHAHLVAAGICEAIAVDLTKPVFNVPVVRVIVPGLEPLCDVPGYVPGARARKHLAGSV